MFYQRLAAPHLSLMRHIAALLRRYLINAEGARDGAERPILRGVTSRLFRGLAYAHYP